MISAILKIEDKCNYSEYQIQCVKDNLFALPIGEFAHIVGELLVAKKAYPNLDDISALNALRTLNTEQHKTLIETAGIQVAAPCDSCGGGKER